MPIERALSFRRREDGHVAVIVALTLTVLMGFTALGVDTAALYRQKAALQSVADLTAISAMGAPDRATPRAQAALAGNGQEPAALRAMNTGRYLRNPALPPEDRFAPLPPGSPGINAVRIALADRAPLHFGQVVTGQQSVPLSVGATASRTGAASFSLTSHVARMNPATLNAALSVALDREVALEAATLHLLAGADIRLGTLLAGITARSGDGGRNPAEILDREVSLRALFQSLAALLPPKLAAEIGVLPDITLAGVEVSARAHTRIGQSQVERIVVTHDDIAAGDTTRHFGSGDLPGTAVGSLLSPDRLELRLSVNESGLLTPPMSGLLTEVMALLPGRLLSALAGPVDAVLDGTPTTAGLRLGEGELTLTGHHCELIRLVD